MILPDGPVPDSPARSTLFSSARILASGLANCLPPVDFAGADEAAGVATGAAAAGVGAAAAGVAGAAAAGAPLSV